MRATTPLLLVAAVLTALTSAACQPSDADDAADLPPQTLTIASEDWNGWDPDHRPTPETTTLTADVGASVTVEGLGSEVTFEVVEVRDGEVTVSSDERLAPTGETGGSNLNDLVDEFTVATDEETELDSPTLDAGYSYTFTLAS